jgi:Paf1
VPFDPKLLKYPHPDDRLYKCFESSLMKKHRYDLVHPDGDQGLSCNPFEMGFLERATKNPNGTDFLIQEKLVPRKDLLDPKDLQLLVGPVEKMAKTKEAPVVPWLRRTEYISSERASFGRNRADSRFRCL